MSVESIDAAALEQFITEQMEKLHIPGVIVFANRATRITPIIEWLWAEVREGETDELEATPE